MPNIRDVATHACRKTLEPVIRILLHCGMTFGEFADVARSVFVDVATRDFGLRGRPTNVSRVALLTGLTRREVRRQRDLLEKMEQGAGGDRVSAMARLLLGWHTDPGYSDDQGPRPLPLNGDDPSFETLYRSYGGGDVPLTVTLKELISTGAVERLENGMVRALSRYYMPSAADPLAVERAGDVLADIARTIYYNLHRSEGAISRFEGRATSRRIPAGAEAEFREFIERRGQEFLEEVDDWLTANEDRPRDDDATPTRLGIGVYQIR